MTPANVLDEIERLLAYLADKSPNPRPKEPGWLEKAVLGNLVLNNAASLVADSRELGQLRKALEDAKTAWRDADRQRLVEHEEAEAEAAKWKAEGDMYGWNFHQGKAGGMTTASIIFYRVWKVLDAALTPRKDG
jgi:hypothetical protein